MTLFRPVPRAVGRAVSYLVLLSWAVSMGFLGRAYLQATSLNLATDLARYGSAAQWRGVYYRGEKIGFTVDQTIPTAAGFELQEDGRLQMSLLGATSAATIQTKAQLDSAFSLQSFQFSLDPGTGAVRVNGRVTGKHISLQITTTSGTQTSELDLSDTPVLSLNLPRRLAQQGLKPGTRSTWLIFDPATLSNQPALVEIGKREIVSTAEPVQVALRGRKVYRMITRPVPAFRIEMTFSGLHTTSWLTDTGEVVREESQLGLLSVRESPETARAMAISRGMQGDMLEEAAVVARNSLKTRIDDPRDVRVLRLRIEGADLTSPDLQGAGQSLQGDVMEIRDARTLQAEAADRDVARYTKPEPLIESDDPAIHAAAIDAVAGVAGTRARAERLTRRVNAMLDKKPTISLPSAREVLRTRVGDCNEHTALYVAMARSLGIPSRISVGLAYSHGAFYYHAWPEVYVDEGNSRGLWLPVDPTFNQFPADAAHVRLARGGLDKQAAILPLIGHIRMTIVGLELAPGSSPVLVGRRAADTTPLSIPLPTRVGMTCWSSPSR